MPRRSPVLTALILIAACALPAGARAAPARPVRVSATFADSLRQAIEKDRADTGQWLKSSPTSYLATVQRRDYDERTTLVVGSAPGADVRIEDPGVKGRHLRVTVTGDSFRVEAMEAGATFTVRDSVMAAATLPASTIGLARYRVRLSHQRFPAIIVFDPNSPRFAHYKGLSYFPVDLSYRYELPLTPNPHPDTVVILSTRGHRRHALRVGWFDFMVGRRACRLEATRLLEPGVGENDFSIFFRDATTGKESYGVGRYLEPIRLANGRYVLDFNVAYNPACAFSDHYNCPIPTRANRLPVAIRAGEKDPHYYEH